MKLPRPLFGADDRCGGRAFHLPAAVGLFGMAVLAAGPLSAAQGGTECFCGAGTLPPPGAHYIATGGGPLDCGGGVLLRDVQLHSIADRVAPPAAGAAVWQETTATLRLEVSFDSGASWHPEEHRTITRYEWDFDYVAGDTTAYSASARIEPAGGGGGGIRLRTRADVTHPGTTTRRAVGGGYMIDSFFDIFLEVSTDGGGSYRPADRPCHLELRTDHRPAVPVVAPTRLLPPPCDELAMPPGTEVIFPNGITLRAARQRLFDAGALPPAAGDPPLTHHFESQLDLQVSMGGGSSFVPLRSQAVSDVVMRRLTAGADDLLETEVTGFTASGGELPPGVLIRESPALRSGGLAGLVAAPDDWRVSSFFDIFLELSTDGGLTWLPGSAPARMQSRSIGVQAAYQTDVQPPPDGRHLGRPGETAVFSNGIIVRNLSQRNFSQSITPPPPGGMAVCSYDAMAEVELSLDGGGSFMPLAGSAACTSRLWSQQDLGEARFFRVEVEGMNMSFPGPLMMVLIRESPTRASGGRTSVSSGGPPGGGFMVDSFFDIFLEVSVDGGQTWSPASSGPYTMTVQPQVLPPLVISCPGDINVPASRPSGTVVEFAVTAGGGCAPVVVTCTPPSGSLFPPGLTHVSCVASDGCGQTATCMFDVTVTPYEPPPWFFTTKVLPPPNGLHLGREAHNWFFPNGVVIRDLRERGFSASVVPPPLGDSVSHTFGSQLDFQLSLDGGGTWQPCTAMASTGIRLDHAADDAGTELHGLEVESMTISGGTLPPGLLIRESPTRASSGTTRIRATAGGFMISSFFDIFTEVSTDGGGTWNPCLLPDAIWVYPDPVLAAPSPWVLSYHLPPPDDQLVSTRTPAAATASGFQLESISVRDSDASAPPPTPAAPTTTTLGAETNIGWNFGGGPRITGRAPATVTLRLTRLGSGSDTLCEAEVTGFDLTGGDLPAGVLIRESPTRASRGMTKVTGGFGFDCAVDSFFDIFIEVSTDGGMTWQPSTIAPLHLEARPLAEPRQFAEASVTPSGSQYRCAAGTTLETGTGVALRNLRERNFSAVLPLPEPGLTATHTCAAWLDMELSTDGGTTWQPATGAVMITLRVTDRLAVGNTRYFDTEMIQLDVAGGTLPAGVMIRESPTRSSPARTAVRQIPDGPIHVDSFFDIFLEVSTDGGGSWAPVAGAPATMMLERAGPTLPPTITCPADVTVRAAEVAGMVVNYPPPAVSGGCPPVEVLCDPPSGSMFPVGATTVHCVASDSCGNQAWCSFRVTVLPPLERRYFPGQLLPPPTGMLVQAGAGQVVLGNGMLVRNVACRGFDASVLPPPAQGDTVSHSFGAQVELELSFDGGLTWAPHVAPGALHVLTVNDGPAGAGATLYGEELLQLAVHGGSLPAGIMIRESPTRASAGETRIEPIPGGSMISSFFDIYIEVSTDGGLTWWPGDQPVTLALTVDPATVPPAVAPRNLVPLPNGRYSMPPAGEQVYPAGIAIREAVSKLFTAWVEPPLAGPGVQHTFDSQFDFTVSTNGGASFAPARAPARMTVAIENVRQFGMETLYDLVVTQLDVAGGDLPAGVLVRESPTRASRGGMTAAGGGGGATVNSFFDIFTEVSTDGGGTWSPASNGPVRLELQRVAADYAAPTSLMPTPAALHDGPPGARAAFSNGIILRNVIQHSFAAAVPAPAPGVTLTHSFGSQVEMDVSTDGGLSWQPANAPAMTTVQITGRLGGDGITGHYDTEVLQFDLAGGGLPAGLLIRESPTRASLGRTTQTLASGGWQIDSFFDIYTEISTDGGLSWQPAANGPLPLSARQPTTLENWRLTRFGTTRDTGLAADTADPDGDRLANILEFATHTDPLLPNGSPAVAGTSGGQLTLTYPRAREAVGVVAMIVEWSTTLEPGSWQDTGVKEVEIPGGDQFVQIIQATMPAVPDGRCFARLRVER